MIQNRKIVNKNRIEKKQNRKNKHKKTNEISNCTTKSIETQSLMFEINNKVEYCHPVGN